MASRNYGLAFDTPYNEKLLSVLEKYNSKKDLNGEPDIFTDRMEGGAMGMRPKMHPHLLHPVLGAMERETSGIKGGRLGQAVDVQKFARKVTEQLDGGAMMRPPGMADPFIHRGAHGAHGMVQSGTMSAYPVYNAVEMRALNGGAMSGGLNLGKAFKAVGKVALPIAEKMAVKAAETAVKSYMSGSAVKKPRGRPRRALEGGLNLGKALGSVGKSISKGFKKATPALKEVGKVALPIAEKMAVKAAETAVKSYMSGSAVKKPRGRPRKAPVPVQDLEGGNILKSITKIGKTLGKPYDKAIGVNPFTAGYDLGHDVIGPALKKELKKGKGVKSAGAVDGRKKRADIVKKIMAEKGMKMIDASKYVKANNLY